jgi:hypothetical protein
VKQFCGSKRRRKGKENLMLLALFFLLASELLHLPDKPAGVENA